MIITYDWLKEMTPVKASLKEFCDKMTLSGSNVEGFYVEAEDITQVITARIVEIKKHPEADRLVICQLDPGPDATPETVPYLDENHRLQIVTAAPNVFEGAVVPVALHGAHLAGDLRIKKGKLRGVVSYGMMCSVEELGYTKQDFPAAPDDGIYILPDNTPLGKDVREVLGINQEVIEFEITPNRSDCFSVEGLAREAAATFQVPFKALGHRVQLASVYSTADVLKVEVQEPELCPRYMARLITNVKNQPSPIWMQKRLRACGVRPLNAIVDITNYVTLAMGQPMHAFDLDYLDGHEILVRHAREGEKIITLDGVERDLQPTDLMIADSNKPVALAGIMGAENSLIKASTTDVIFEIASFDPDTIRKTSSRLGLTTEASLRFARGVDPFLAARAMDYACYLVDLLKVGEPSSSAIDKNKTVKKDLQVPFEAAHINALLGSDLTEETMIEILGRLEITCEKKGEKIYANIPTFRRDLSCEADMAEEIARLYDYNNLPSSLTAGIHATVGGLSPKQRFTRFIADFLSSQGFFQCQTYHFQNDGDLDMLRIPQDDVRRDAIRIQNPLGKEFSCLRTLALPQLLKAAALNHNNGQNRVELFETTLTYRKTLEFKQSPESLAKEEELLTMVLTDKSKTGAELFYTMKGHLESLFEALYLEGASYQRSHEAYLHPGQGADIMVNGKKVASFGILYPTVARDYGLDTHVAIAELRPRTLYTLLNQDRRVSEPSHFPTITRDLALVCPKIMPVEEVNILLRRLTAPYDQVLSSFAVFDVYEGQPLEADQKSLSYHFIFSAQDRTLTEEEIQPCMDALYQGVVAEGLDYRK